jgi:hypothetical protein
MNTGMKVFTLFALYVVSLVGFFVSVEETYAATRSAASCSYADVSAAVTSAAAGDTVTVPAGSCTWSSTLAITKGLSLIGAGSGSTIITSNVSQFLITYNPSDKSANLLFRISGFTFDLANSTSHSGIDLSSGKTTVYQTKVRIDHNRFINLETTDTQMHYIFHAGVYGVIDNNDFGQTFYSIRTPSAAQNDGGRAIWNNWDGIIFGAADNNLYFEDNTFALKNYGQGFALTDCQEGGRYAFRYNTITLTGSGQMFDMHGNNGQQYSCMGGELYGNNIVAGSGGQFLDHRGGRVFVFGNNFGASGFSVQIREEQADSSTPVNYVGPNPPQYPQHVNGSYY